MGEAFKTAVKAPETKKGNQVSQVQKDIFNQPVSSPVEQILFLQRSIGNQAVGRLLRSGAFQAKLRIGQAGDIYEKEADRVAEQVMRMPESVVSKNIAVSGQAHGILIQRMCPKCANRLVEEEKFLHPKEVSGSTQEITPGLEANINAVRGGGQPLPESVRAFYEPRFRHDFSHVRVHTDAKAAESARDVNANAYTMGQNIVFGAGRFASGTHDGRRLIAHELTHVVQQGGVYQGEGAISGTEMVSYSEKRKSVPSKNLSKFSNSFAMPQILQRQGVDHWATADSTRNILLHPATAPTRVRSDTLAYLQGGLVNDNQLRPRVSAIIGPGSTILGIAQAIRPHFGTAAATGGPNGQGGPAAPTETEIAQALLVYSRYYLAVPNMTRFTDGIRLPLPIEIDVANGDWIVNSNLIRLWAQSFDPAWQPLLTQRPSHLGQPNSAALDQEVTDFMTNHPDALSRGIMLQARVMTNAFESVFFFFKLFERLGAATFDVAMEFLSNSVNHQIQLLASLTAGNAILRRLKMALSNPPTGLSASRQSDLQHANIKLQNALGLSAGQTATTARELPETAQQRANRPGGVGRWQQVAAQDPAGGMHRMVLGRDVLAGVIAASNIGGVSYTGPAYGGRMSPAQFIQNNQALLNPLGDAFLAARLDLVSAISVNEGFLDAIRLRDRGVVSAGLQQSSAHVEIELPSLMYRFKTASPDLFMLYFGIYGLDVEPNGVDGNNNPKYRFVQVQPNGNRVPLATWNQILTFFGGAGGPAAYSFLTDWAARFREAAIASPEFSVAQLLEAASRLDRILREVPTLNVPTVGPVDLNTLITSEFGVALILDSHINQPGRVLGDLQRATTAAGHNVDPNVQERDIMIHYEPNRHTFDTPARNANINALGLDHAHGSFAGW